MGGLEHSPYKESEMLYDVEHTHAAVKIQHMFRLHQRKASGREIWRDAEEHAASVPDPGAYEVDSAFDDKNMRGASASWRSQTERDVFAAGQKAFADDQERFEGARSMYEHTKRQIPGLEHSPYKESEMLYDVEHTHAAVKIQHMFRLHQRKASGREIWRDAE